jgi:hypothetical protein
MLCLYRACSLSRLIVNLTEICNQIFDSVLLRILELNRMFGLFNDRVMFSMMSTTRYRRLPKKLLPGLIMDGDRLVDFATNYILLAKMVL